MKHLSFEILNKLISEIYPFSSGTIKKFEDQLDFDWLSRNKNVKWSVELISEFYGKWNWEALDESTAVFNSLTLGLFFPEKADLPLCTCNRKEEFCDYSDCAIIYNKIRFAKSQYTERPDAFIELMMMCDSGFIDEEMITQFYLRKDPSKILRFKIPYK